MIETVTNLSERLRSIGVFSDLPAETLEWLAARMVIVYLNDGEILFAEGQQADRMVALLEGELRAQIEHSKSDGRFYQVFAGQVTGMLPFSRLKNFPLTLRAASSTTVATLSSAYFPELMEQQPELGARLVGVMADRIRDVARAEQQRDKLAALGRLSAGLAHELNNPAAAARRAAEALRQAVSDLRGANLRLVKRGLSQELRLFLAELECSWSGAPQGMDSLERSDREEAIALKLEAAGVDRAWQLAPDLVEAGCDLPGIENILARFDPVTLPDVLLRLASSFTVSRLVNEIDSSTGRISELVRSIKEYSYMDQMPEQEVDIHDGLESTLVMLRHRFKGGVNVTREYDRTLPHVCAFGRELNQVWTNLIDNAVDAMGGKGELRIRTSRYRDFLLVDICDNGPGVPPEIQSKIFEPFFTTKQAGEGTGLGLDTVFRIVRKHHGDVQLISRPGDTVFRVRLPISGAKGEQN